jgi:glycerol uptake facilitator-like aquaporin
LVGEAVGTFGLALAALSVTTDQPLLVGLTYAVLLLGLTSVSGGHFNPAVTFGLWAANKLDLVKVPFYWIAQLIGALAAFIVIGTYNGNGSNLDLANFAQWDWPIFWVELIGAAVFLFGVVATLRNVIGVGARAAGVGLSLTVGLVVAGGLLTANATREQTAVQNGESQTVSRTFGAQSAALNPAIALAQTERDVDAINKSISGKSTANSKQKTPSHFTLPVVLGSLLGAALGTNLYLMLAGLSWRDKVL